MKTFFIAIVLISTIWSCNRLTYQKESSDCHCDEEQLWKLVLESKSIKDIYTKGRLYIDNAYSYDNSRRAYWDAFTCRFYELIIDPNGVDSLQMKYGKDLWNYGKRLVSQRNVRYPINVQHLAKDYENVTFYDFDSLKNADVIEYPYGTTYYPYGTTPILCKGIGGIMLDDNHHGAYLIGLDFDSCKVVSEEYYWYPYYTGYCGVAASEVDWIDIIDFDMSLDSFYQYQYYEVLQYLDSLVLDSNPNIESPSLYRNHPELKGKW